MTAKFASFDNGTLAPLNFATLWSVPLSTEAISSPTTTVEVSHTQCQIRTPAEVILSSRIIASGNIEWREDRERE